MGDQFETRWGGIEKKARMHWWGHIFKFLKFQLGQGSRDHVAATEHYLDNLSTYFTPIRPIPLSSLRPSLHKKSPLNSGHTFVVYTANHCTDSWQMDFKERERVKTPSKSNTNEEGEPNYEP